MATFVLVHGAWHGSWCWKRVRKELQARGHQVFTPTLTGVGERSHLLSPQVNLDTHIEDVVNLLQWEELSDVVLCGHSYGGCVISGVVDRVPDRVGALVYLDAFVLEDGQCLFDTLPPSQREQRLETASDPEAWKVPPIPAEVFNVNARDREWVNRQCTVQPLATFLQPIKLRHRTADAAKPVTFILATRFGDSPFRPFYERAQTNGWKTLTVPCGHDVMLDEPEELTKLLLNSVGAQPATA
jgi:pimeloyl-ACP methyl ester carboxylesterase